MSQRSRTAADPSTRTHAPNAPACLLADPYLLPFREKLDARRGLVEAAAARLARGEGRELADTAAGHEYFGVHRDAGGWVVREWAPNATGMTLIAPATDWQVCDAYRFVRLDGGVWELRLSGERLAHGDLYRLAVTWPEGKGERIPAYARRVVQDYETGIFSAQVWSPETPYEWQNEPPAASESGVLIYEAHVGMAREAPSVGTYTDFRREVLPGIVEAGYNTIQLMAIQEHPYYGSFGYHVSSFFAPSSRFGTPTELKQLIDAAHGYGLRVIIDLVHSHAVRNEVEGLGRYDGSRHQFFHEGPRGVHDAWDSYCFDYGKPEVLHFLLSNCRYWLDEFRLDGFRFDGVTSMLYRHHGLGVAFTSYEQYFDDQVDADALVYLALANRVIHQVRPDAVTVAEDVSGMPGIAAPEQDGGCGFDYRLAMGVTDMWFKLMDRPDEAWSMGTAWHELTNRRRDERTISYLECHDQAIVGGQTAIFRLIGDAMYDSMHVDSQSLAVDRGIALHKMMRLATVAAAGHGYLNFMGNEFGHPEWIDFPREGNQWSYHHARRLWSLRDNRQLRFHFLAEFDRDLMHTVRRFRLFDARPQLLRIDDERKLLAFERNGLYVFLNFHPSVSYEHCAFEVLPGSYELLMDSDSERYGGVGRVLPSQRFFTQASVSGNERRALLRLYLPCRSALVLERLCASS